MIRNSKTAAPLDTDDRVLKRAASVVGRAIRREPALRFLPLDEGSRPTSTDRISLTGRPSRFDEDMAEGVAAWVDECADVVQIEELVGVWQRRGSAEYESHELPWFRHLDVALRLRGYPVRAWLLSHSRGIRWVALDDLLPEVRSIR